MTVEQEINRSQLTFITLVWPRFRDVLGKGQVIPVETVTDSQMAKTLDVAAGVDMWWVIDSHVYPIASRVQYGSTAWRTFTVRSSRPSGLPTEYQKRRASIHSGSLYPRLTVHAYVDGTDLLAAAAVDTAHLIERCSELEHQVRCNPADGAQFIWVGWDQIDPSKIHIIDDTDRNT